MKKVIGYVVSVVGIAVMAVGFGMIPIDWEIFNIVPMEYVAGFGLVLVGVGVLMALKGKDGGKKSGGDGGSEVPIYEGVGKSRRVVGYRKD